MIECKKNEQKKEINAENRFTNNEANNLFLWRYNDMYIEHIETHFASLNRQLTNKFKLVTKNADHEIAMLLYKLTEDMISVPDLDLVFRAEMLVNRINNDISVEKTLTKDQVNMLRLKLVLLAVKIQKNIISVKEKFEFTAKLISDLEFFMKEIVEFNNFINLYINDQESTIKSKINNENNLSESHNLYENCDSYNYTDNQQTKKMFEFFQFEKMNELTKRVKTILLTTQRCYKQNFCFIKHLYFPDISSKIEKKAEKCTDQKFKLANTPSNEAYGYGIKSNTKEKCELINVKLLNWTKYKAYILKKAIKKIDFSNLNVPERFNLEIEETEDIQKIYYILLQCSDECREAILLQLKEELSVVVENAFLFSSSKIRLDNLINESKAFDEC
ncbi:hypothetical protein EDEG_03834 [Edhazardia aedis USNM 41457]|uniref:Uncharacterized protein n=1 Tax=Edhazardia aedis (strain USNM 41457) TaxID=1003232 RepID=J8ZPL3_EDHAE|nr:hypothetical protein EDEG_03834 [Edhazardia aedis USNM 41457]|eukprot:EJW01618.1 hypothetical protein EDEG_03834 [Edhazardia aedis USNM 41457]